MREKEWLLLAFLKAILCWPASRIMTKMLTFLKATERERKKDRKIVGLPINDNYINY